MGFFSSSILHSVDSHLDVTLFSCSGNLGVAPTAPELGLKPFHHGGSSGLRGALLASLHSQSQTRLPYQLSPGFPIAESQMSGFLK